jgi:cyclopropane-fatty-acyl-phospholipid synthase
MLKEAGKNELADFDSKTKETIESLIQPAGIHINGSNPWDIKVHDNRFYQRLFAQESLGLGESYMDGWWESERLDQFFYHLLKSGLMGTHFNKLRKFIRLLLARIYNYQNKTRAFEVGQQHYDISFELYRRMLDKNLNYSCAYWNNTSDLEEAQEKKLDLICRKLYLEKGMRLLDIGSGWGSLAKYAAEKYDVEVVGVTVSKEQLKIAEERCKGLPIEFRLQDYRALNEKFDRVVSVGMFEHVGYKNYATYFNIVSNCLIEDGLFLLHTIGGNRSRVTGDPWVLKYIFPNSMLPSMFQVTEAAEGNLILEDCHNIGPHYDKTLLAWHQNFRHNWHDIHHLYDERFYRMWQYYLLSFAGAFRARLLQVWQLVYSKHGIVGEYKSIR